jgi:hypothetical protein
MTIEEIGQVALALVAIPALLAVYFMPALVAGKRRLADSGSIMVLNFFLGWTFVGWVIPLAMAVAGTAKKEV